MGGGKGGTREIREEGSQGAWDREDAITVSWEVLHPGGGGGTETDRRGPGGKG